MADQRDNSSKIIKVNVTNKDGSPVVPSAAPAAPASNSADLFDPNCDPDNPQRITFQDVTSAAFLIKGGVEYTACPRSHISDDVGIEIYLKKEFQQYTGSFKERGARYALLKLSDEQKKIGVVSASLGNHAQGISYHGLKLGIPVTVIMPLAAPIMKIQKCRRYGANVVVSGVDMGEAKALAIKMAREQNMVFINGFDHPHVMSGQGTIGLEICEQVSQVDAVVVPIGGGGLMAGIATAIRGLRPNVKIIGVESEKCSSFTRAMENNMPFFTPVESTLADGLAVPVVGYNAYATIRPLLDKMIVVKEEWVALAILRLVEKEKCVVEGAGATGLAAILQGKLDEFLGKKVVLILSGGNIDTTILGRCLERGLAAEGRLLRFLVRISDRPGGLCELCNLMTGMGVSIKEIMHERAWIRDIYHVEVKVVCETYDWDHSQLIRKNLEEKYPEIKFSDIPMAIPKAIVLTKEGENAKS